MRLKTISLAITLCEIILRIDFVSEFSIVPIISPFIIFN